MIDKVKDYLVRYGFSKEDIDLMEEENDNVFFLVISDIKWIFNFLENKGFSKKDIIYLMNKNQMMMTCSKKRYLALDEIYTKDLEYTNEELKELLYKTEYLYAISPIQFKEIINYLKNKGLDNNKIKKLIYDYPNILTMSKDEFESLFRSSR